VQIAAIEAGQARDRAQVGLRAHEQLGEVLMLERFERVGTAP